jgi:hypothetical protein
MTPSFTHDVPSQRVVFASGALTRVGEEAERLGLIPRARGGDAGERRAAR